MKITKRIAKEVHNEKQKSFDEGKITGRQEAMQDEIDFLKTIMYNEQGMVCLFSDALLLINERLLLLQDKASSRKVRA